MKLIFLICWFLSLKVLQIKQFFFKYSKLNSLKSIKIGRKRLSLKNGV